MKIVHASLILLLFTACSSPDKNTSAAIATNTDEAAIKQAVDNAYKSLGFSAGTQPAFDSIQYAFIPQAQLINFIADTAQILSIGDFVKAYKNYVETSKVQSFSEEEIYGRTDQYGKIAQRISSYKTYINRTDMPAERGVNSFQLIKTKDGWKVSSIIWDIESKNLPIPRTYLLQ
ncbi:hypothetical protein [Parafilimonas terrae]|uniref:DUF4440 domain-containing protein n=1 Tax=Parafilimonas terrae TaxID=1465490 RepID=A0A1I5Z0Q3_9BACT|nr:hypothetical protein [Parafilimonas terrae]SFQ50083.1 hypothetical protein SAMN05444277_11561 [Parafilimonas terrae]